MWWIMFYLHMLMGYLLVCALETTFSTNFLLVVEDCMFDFQCVLCLLAGVLCGSVVFG